jgi:hypothetical protein
MEDVDNLELGNYKKCLGDLVNKSSDDFEKQLSFISAGALALSITFMDKLVSDLDTASYKSLLIIGWIVLGMTLILNLISHLYSAQLHNRTLKEIEENNLNYFKNSIARNTKISIFNWITVIFLIFGIALIIIFSSVNLYNG